jgi:transcriptional regulator with XRE-family HTH domain
MNPINWTAKNIKNLRLRLGYTQAQMAQKLGVRQNTISRIESGTNKTSGAVLLLLDRLAKRKGAKNGNL